MAVLRRACVISSAIGFLLGLTLVFWAEAASAQDVTTASATGGDAALLVALAKHLGLPGVFGATAWYVPHAVSKLIDTTITRAGEELQKWQPQVTIHIADDDLRARIAALEAAAAKK